VILYKKDNKCEVNDSAEERSITETEKKQRET